MRKRAATRAARCSQTLQRNGEPRAYCALAVSSNSFRALGLMFAQMS
jgi:hypothetical protein